ncbi:MAG: sugar kinase [Acidimicrobiaceae bacterium]|nr:sugar kinase [Acidimicrobiaceae bacterium]
MNHSASVPTTQSPPVDVAALGESMLTVRPDPDEAAFEWEVSGAESNVARYCAALGLEAAWISQVGTDLAGDLVLSVIEAAGVDVSGVRRVSDRQTGLMLKEVTANERRVRYYRAGSAAANMAPPLGPSLRRGLRILHLTGITLGLSSMCRQLVESLVCDRATASRLSFDVNWRPAVWDGGDPPTALREAANQCDIVFVGLDEARDLWGTESIAAIRALLPCPSTVVVKDAANGAHADLFGRRLFVPALGGPVIEPVGAGDAFAAGFLFGVLQHDGDVEACLRLGHITAMSALAQRNDVGPVADDRTVRLLLDMSPQQWRTAHLDLSGPRHRVTTRTRPHSAG